MIFCLVSFFIFFSGFGIILAKYMGFGMFGVWVAMIVDWIARTIFFTIRYNGRRWETKNKI